MSEWPTKSVQLNHLEAMGICMALMFEEQEGGLSKPQQTALDKVQVVLGEHLDELGRPA